MSKKAAPKTLLTKIKQEVDKANNFIDYFLVLGVNPSICLNPQLYDHNVEVQKAITLQPEIISKYPPFDKALVSIDDGILTYCNSKKFGLVEGLVRPDEEIFFFILDNNFFSIDYPQKYVTCLRFYEAVSSYKLLKELMEEKTRNAGEQQNTRNLRRNCSVNANKKNNESVTGNMRQRLNTMVGHQSKSRDNFLFIPKVICLVSIYPFVNQHKQILQHLHDYSTRSGITIPLEKLLLNLIIEVPVPPRGLSTVEYQLTKDKPILLSRSEMNKLPSIEFELEQICLCFNLNQIKTIFKHLLFETKIIFFSESINKLFHVILGFLSFLYPLKYPFQVASYVPEQNFSIIESISPYILGINQAYAKTFFTDNHLEISDMTILIVDIDNKNVELSITTEEFPKLPKNIGYKLEKDIIELAGKWKGKIKSSNNSEFNKELSQYFFNCILGIMKNYAQYINNDYFTSHENIQNTNITTLFKVNDYVQSFPSSEQAFYAKFVNDSQMFSDFIYKKMIPKDNKEKLEILFLDESIMEQKWTIFDKKDNLFFLSSEEYKIKNNYVAPFERALNIEETKALLSEDLRDKMLTYAQVVNIGEKDNSISFEYILFPMLNTETFMSERSLSEYFILPSLNDELESINTDIVSKSYLNQIKVQNFEMKNYLYLSWLQLWAFSFHYLDEVEHEFRFGQMLNVLDKVTHHEIEVFNLLFDALKNKNEFILCLYKKLIVFKINPSCYIYSIISKLIDKSDMNLFKTQQDGGQSGQLYRKMSKAPTLMRKRSIRNAFEEEVLLDKVKFYPYYNCDECQTPLDLEKLSTNFSEMKREIMWAYCTPCDKYMLPKLEVRLGVELNIDLKNEGQTSTLEQIVLHSPYYLKINVKDGIYREYGLALDINQFKMKFTPLFWNAIWYFRILKLDYTFFLPYADSVFSLPEKRAKTTFTIMKSVPVLTALNQTQKQQILLKIKENQNKDKANEKEKEKPIAADNKRKKKMKYDSLKQSHPNSFELIHKQMKVLGHSSILEITGNESTFSNTNILDNSLNSDMSLSKMSDSYYDNDSSFPSQRSLTHNIIKIIEEKDNEEELLDSNNLKNKSTSTLNINAKQMAFLESPDQIKEKKSSTKISSSQNKLKPLY